jgi:mono/diheme cytochrome c family protein
MSSFFMFRARIAAIIFISALALSACFGSKPSGYVIADSKAYEASLFRQHCAVCHGPEGEGKTLEDGTIVPSLRKGEFKFKTESEIYHQISDGGNGMTPFRDQLTDRELRLLADLVHNKLRAEK